MSATADDPTVPISAAYRMVGALFLIYILAWLDRLIISMMVEPIKATLGLGDFEMSLVLGPAFAISYALFAIPLGWAVDRYPRRLVVALGVTVWSVATTACAFATSFPELMTARIFVGIGEAALLPAAYSLIPDAFPRDKVTFATSLFQTAGKFGSALAFGLGGLLIAFTRGFEGQTLPLLGNAEGWQITFAAVGLPGMIFILLAFSFPDPGRREHATGRGDANEPIGVFLRRNAALVALVTIAFTSLAVIGYSLTSWVPAYAEREFGWLPEQYGPMLSLMNIFGAICLIGLGKAVDALFARGVLDAHLRFYSWLLIVLLPVLVGAWFIENPYLFFAAYALMQLVSIPYIVYCSALIVLLAPNKLRGRLIGSFLFISSLVGFGAGPTIVGALSDYVFSGPRSLGYALACVTIGGTLTAILAMRLAMPGLRAKLTSSIKS